MLFTFIDDCGSRQKPKLFFLAWAYGVHLDKVLQEKGAVRTGQAVVFHLNAWKHEMNRFVFFKQISTQLLKVKYKGTQRTK